MRTENDARLLHARDDIFGVCIALIGQLGSTGGERVNERVDFLCLFDGLGLLIDGLIKPMTFADDLRRLEYQGYEDNQGDEENREQNLSGGYSFI